MKLYAHVGRDGNIEGLIAGPEGEPIPMLTPSPGVQVREIQEHGITGHTVELDQLEKLLETSTVAMTPAYGKLVRRKKK